MRAIYCSAVFALIILVTFAPIGSERFIGVSLPENFLVLSILVLLLTIENRGIARSIFDTIAKNIWFFGPYTIYLASYAIAVFANDSDEDLIQWASQFFRAICIGLLATIFFRRGNSSDFKRWIWASSVISFVLYWIFVFVVFAKNGQFVFLELASALANGDRFFLEFGFYDTIFSLDLGNSQTEEQKITRRNGLMGAIITLLILLFYSYESKRGSNFIKWVHWSIVSLIVLTVLISMTRGNTIMLLSYLFIVGVLLQMNRGRIYLSRKTFYICLASMMALGSWSIYFYSTQSASDSQRKSQDEAYAAVVERYSDLTDDSRIRIGLAAWREIKQDPFKIRGVNEPIRSIDIQNHNLFLGSWYDAGIFGLFSSLGWYFLFLFSWLFSIRKYVLHRIMWMQRCHVEYILAIPVIPLFRVMINGSSGSLRMAEIICLCLYLGVTSRNIVSLSSFRTT